MSVHRLRLGSVFPYGGTGDAGSIPTTYVLFLSIPESVAYLEQLVVLGIWVSPLFLFTHSPKGKNK